MEICYVFTPQYPGHINEADSTEIHIDKKRVLFFNIMFFSLLYNNIILKINYFKFLLQIFLIAFLMDFKFTIHLGNCFKWIDCETHTFGHNFSCNNFFNFYHLKRYEHVLKS